MAKEAGLPDCTLKITLLRVDLLNLDLIAKLVDSTAVCTKSSIISNVMGIWIPVHRNYTVYVRTVRFEAAKFVVKFGRKKQKYLQSQDILNLV